MHMMLTEIRFILSNLRPNDEEGLIIFSNAFLKPILQLFFARIPNGIIGSICHVSLHCRCIKNR